MDSWEWEVFVEKAELFMTIIEHKWDRGKRGG